MTSLGLVLAFISEHDDESHSGGSCGTASETQPIEFPASMPSDSNLGGAFLLTRELLVETCDAGAAIPVQTATTAAARSDRGSTALAAAV